MPLSIEEIRNKLKSQQEKKGGNFTADNAVYPFWNIPDGSNATLRFLPDGDSNNDFFWAERIIIRLPFTGVKGEHENEVMVQVPCMEAFGETCPILSETRPWWKDQDLVPIARKYWKKKSYIFQGFVVNNPMEEQNSPTNPVRRFVINPSIFDVIKASLMDPDMESLPIDYVNGRDFKLSKTQKGGYSNYASSSWSIRSRSLTEAEHTAIKEFGLFNLKEFLPKKPTPEEVEMIKDMFHSSVNGDSFDMEKYGKYYRPNGFAGTPYVASNTDDDTTVAAAASKVSVPSGASSALAALKAKTQSTQSEVIEQANEAVSTESTPSSGSPKMSADELLKMIRNRKTS